MEKFPQPRARLIADVIAEIGYKELRLKLMHRELMCWMWDRAGYPRRINAEMWWNDKVADGLLLGKYLELVDATEEYVCYQPGYHVLFVEASDEPPPASPVKGKPVKNVSDAALDQCIAKHADGTRPVSEVKALVEEELGTTIAEKNLWRPAWRKVPKDKKLAPGMKPGKRGGQTQQR